MTKTKIQGFDYTWNPVVGCLRNCFYCYAKNIAKRFANKFIWYDHLYYESIKNHGPFLGPIIDDYLNFKPQLVERNLNIRFPKKPAKIFVNSMSDIEFWKDEWFELVFARIKENPQHEYYFLTKSEEVEIYTNKQFKRFVELSKILKNNLFLGLTITKNDTNLDYLTHLKSSGYQGNLWLSYEPLLEDIKSLREDGWMFSRVDYVVIGKCTGTLKKKYPCKQEWINNIVSGCKKYNIRYLVKNA